MLPSLTTITPFWGRPEALRVWLSAVKAATSLDVQHFVYFVTEPPPDWWESEAPVNIFAIYHPAPLGISIGYYHNLGAKQTETTWIMKLDVDALPNIRYFTELMKVLKGAGPRQWFNGGMLYLNQAYSFSICRSVDEKTYAAVMANRRTYSAIGYLDPAATNFICRKREYLEMGGCDPRFYGYGWEDYQQIYSLEHHQRQRDPLPGLVTLDNVTRRCRDEISRPKARQLWQASSWLCLLHKWHPSSNDGIYRTSAGMARNREILFERVLAGKAKNVTG